MLELQNTSSRSAKAEIDITFHFLSILELLEKDPHIKQKDPKKFHTILSIFHLSLGQTYW